MGHGLGARRPTRATRFLLRAPVWLYRWHLGAVLGQRFVLLEHRGRRTGQLRRNVLEVVDYEPGFRRVVVCSGWGERSDWYRNVMANPQVCYSIGSTRRCGIAHRLDPIDAETALRHYGDRHPRALRALANRVLGDEGSPDVDGAAATLAAALPVLALTA
jgi:deazaflavin-dependent oxidoreductase (nitroreductase family)